MAARFAFSAHARDRKRHCWPSAGTPSANRDRGRLAVEPDPNDRAVKDEPNDRLLAERASVPGVPVALHLPPRRRADTSRQDNLALPARWGVGDGMHRRGVSEVTAGERRGRLV